MSASADRIAENVQAVRGRIAAAAQRAGRSADEVRLVAITKYVGVAEAEALIAAGCLDLGESRPQSLWTKADALGPQVRWHMIGHLQRNKIRRTLPRLALLHAGDSLSLLGAANEAAAEAGRPLPVLIEVNISGDVSKHGFRPEHVAGALEKIADLRHITVEGLMAMASREGDLDRARREFAALRALRDRLALEAPPNVRLAELSMGMSGDFEVAIEEGATMVRIGSALFEGLEAAEQNDHTIDPATDA